MSYLFVNLFYSTLIYWYIQSHISKWIFILFCSIILVRPIGVLHSSCRFKRPGSSETCTRLCRGAQGSEIYRMLRQDHIRVHIISEEFGPGTMPSVGFCRGTCALPCGAEDRTEMLLLLHWCCCQPAGSLTWVCLSLSLSLQCGIRMESAGAMWH